MIKTRLFKIPPFLAALIVTLFAVTGVNAEDFATTRDPIYVVDMQRVFAESILGKAASNNLQEDVRKKRAVLEKQKVELDKLKQELDKQASLLSGEALRAKEQQFLKKQRDFERAFNDQRDELTQKNKEAMEKVLKRINEVMKELAEKNDYKIILEKDMRVIVYANNKFDISDDIIKQLDNEHLGL